MFLLRALAILVTLVAMLVLLAQTGQEPVPVALQWGATNISTTAPVFVTLLLMGIVVVFYAGRLLGWLVNLPRALRNLARGHSQQSQWAALTGAFTALYLGNTKDVTKALKKLDYPPPHAQPLVTLLKLQTGQLTAAQAEPFLTHPALGPVICLHFARQAAQQKNWADVRRYTAAGLQLSANHPTFTTLGFKAMLNLNDPSAIASLPQLKPMLTRNTYQLLSTVVAAGISTPHAATLGHPWVKSFHKWLPTPSETWPDEPKAAPYG